jgi:RNA polymerase sigma factor (sigma-70 family)
MKLPDVEQAMAWARQGALRRTDDPLLAEEAAEQAVQKLWLAACNGTAPLNVRSWLRRLGENEVARLARRDEWKQRVHLTDDSWSRLADPKGCQRQPARSSRAPVQRKLRIEGAMKQLTAAEREAIRLVLLGGVSLHAAANRLRTNRSTLKRTLKRAARKLRAALR